MQNGYKCYKENYPLNDSSKCIILLGKLIMFSTLNNKLSIICSHM